PTRRGELMTTDTTALQERLWDAIAEARDLPGKTGEAPTESIVVAVLPIIAAEARAAKVEALREMQEHHEREADKAQTPTIRAVHLTIADSARKRADEYETGDRA